MAIFPDNPADFPDPREVMELSGLDFIRGVRDGRYPAAPIARTVGFEMDEVEEGRVVFSGEPHFGVYNPIGSVHGGWYGVLLDSAMGCAVHSSLPPGRAYTTLEYKITILRAATIETGRLWARGETVRCGRRSAVATGEIVDAQGRIYAQGSTTCLVFDAAP